MELTPYVLRLWLWTAVGSPRSLLQDALVAAALAAAADAVAQRLLGARKLALRRCALMGCYGLLWYGPSNHIWQRLLVRVVSPRGAAPGLLRHVKSVAQRVALDQLAYAPLNNSLMILYVAAVADRLGWAAARAAVRSELPSVQMRGWRFWPLVQAANQFAVPLRVRRRREAVQLYRVVCNSAAAVCWTAFVITRARSRRGSGRKTPVFDLKTGQLHFDKMV